MASEDCQQVYFDFDPLVEIIDDLEIAWPDWPKETPEDEDETVWEKDWRRHGSCTYGKVQGLDTEGAFFRQGNFKFMTAMRFRSTFKT